MRAFVAGYCLLVLAALVLAGCGGPGYATFPSNTKSIVTQPTPNNGTFFNEQEGVSSNSGTATVTVSATYDGTLTTNDTSAFTYPITVTLDGAPYDMEDNLSFTATTVGSPASWFGTVNVIFRNLGIGSHTVVVHFLSIPNFVGSPLADVTIPVTVSANG